MWLLCSLLAYATDVAGANRLGLGISTGAPWAAATGKYYFAPNAAGAVYLAATVIGA